MPRPLRGVVTFALLTLGFMSGLPRPGGAVVCDSCQIAIECCAKAPAFQDTAYSNTFTGEVTVGTAQGILPSDPVVTVFDIQHNLPPLNTNWASIHRYNGPPASPWNAAALGTVFGLTIDDAGNTYVCQSSCYNGDALGAMAGGVPGAIYRLDAITGNASVFATLPNFPDPSLSPPENFPELGNISFDCTHHQFFVTNMEDGRIYRLNTSGTVLSTYDPGADDLGDPGFAPLGERLWAVQWHGSRVYYSVWNRDLGHPSTTPNVVRSVALKANGDFDGFTDRLEVMVPSIVTPSYSGNVSGPISDISFSGTGRMMIGERTMLGPSQVDAHAARALEYVCQAGDWVPGGVFNIGVLWPPGPGQGLGTNCAGGVEYDQIPSTVNAAGRAWATGDALHFNSPDLIYGMQGLPHTGGDITNSYLIDDNGDVSNSNKREIGDVEMPCYGINTGVLEPEPRDVRDRAIGYPSPFERATGVLFSLPKAANVEVGVYDATGRLVRKVQSGRMEAGSHYVTWDGDGAGGGRALPGTYFIRVLSADRTLTSKVVRVN